MKKKVSSATPTPGSVEEVPESIVLECKANGSDAVYSMQLVKAKDGWLVNYQNGRRGDAPTTGTKTRLPIPYAQARSIYTKTIQEKTAPGRDRVYIIAQGYGAGLTAAPVLPASDKVQTGILPQKLTDIDEATALQMIVGGGYGLEEKHDGVSVRICKSGGVITGINKLGLERPLPEWLIAEFKTAPAFIIDGELFEKHYIAYDLLSLETEDCQSVSFKHRHAALVRFIVEHKQTRKVWPSELFTENLTQKIEQFKIENAEGVVLKDLNAPYYSGRKDGNQFKLKFKASASVVVEQINDKRSVRVMVRTDGNSWRVVGNVTIPGKQAIPLAGSVIECEYLYAFKEGSLYQPVYKGIREDVLPEECTIDQLKYKREAANE